MQIRGNQRIWQFFVQHRVVSIVVGHVVVLTTFGVVFIGNAFGATLFGAFAQASCSNGDQTYLIATGDTLGTIASRYHTTWQRLASYNKIANPNIIYVHQRLCIPGHSRGISRVLGPARGMSNFFPQGQCTWWASQRFYQVHGVFVPWKTNADAWQWSARAKDYHWHVSSQPSTGAIIDLQPWVQGAYNLGHVAVVEHMLSNGHVVASNMNWGLAPGQITEVEFTPGPGVTFITN